MNYKLNRNLICKNKKKEKIFVCHLITLETTINPNRLTYTHTRTHGNDSKKRKAHARKLESSCGSTTAKTSSNVRT